MMNEVNPKNSIIDTASNILTDIAQTCASAIQRMHTNAQQQQQELQAQQAYSQKMQNSVYIQRDLAYAMQNMTPPEGLTPIFGPRSITYMPEYCTDIKCFAFFWQKSVYKYPVSKDILHNTKHRINSRIEQSGTRLLMSGYTYENIQAEYPALWHGFKIMEIYNIPDGVILIVRLQ